METYQLNSLSRILKNTSFHDLLNDATLEGGVNGLIYTRELWKIFEELYELIIWDCYENDIKCETLDKMVWAFLELHAEEIFELWKTEEYIKQCKKCDEWKIDTDYDAENESSICKYCTQE